MLSLQPTYPILRSPSRASQQPRERHVNLAPFERATGSRENKSAEVHGEFSQATARGFLFLITSLSLKRLLSLSMHPSFHLRLSVSFPSSLLCSFSPSSPRHRFGNVTHRQHYSDVIVLIKTLGRKRGAVPWHVLRLVWFGSSVWVNLVQSSLDLVWRITIGLGFPNFGIETQEVLYIGSHMTG